MKTLIIALTLSLSSLASISTERGIIREVTCNGPSGLGYIVLEQIKKRNLVRNHLKVNSQELCGTPVRSLSKLSEYGYDALFAGNTYFFELKLKNGFVVGAEKHEKVDFGKILRKAKRILNKNGYETPRWFFSGPTHIDYRVDETTVKNLVEKYTSKDYVDSF